MEFLMKFSIYSKEIVENVNIPKKMQLNNDLFSMKLHEPILYSEIFLMRTFIGRWRNKSIFHAAISIGMGFIFLSSSMSISNQVNFK